MTERAATSGNAMHNVCEITDAARDGSAMSLWSSDVLEPKELPQHTRK